MSSAQAAAGVGSLVQSQGNDWGQEVTLLFQSTGGTGGTRLRPATTGLAHWPFLAHAMPQFLQSGKEVKLGELGHGVARGKR